MAIRKNKRGIKVKRCCASCKYKEIDDYGKRHCTKGFDSCETCRSWRMRDELRKPRDKQQLLRKPWSTARY